MRKAGIVIIGIGVALWVLGAIEYATRPELTKGK